MAIRLKSISKRIPWYLLSKALSLSLIWLFLPYWVFIPVALYLYFKSGPRISDLFLTYTLLISESVAAKWWLGFANIGKILVEFNSGIQYSLALVFFAAWFLLFGIKELAFLNRKESLVLLQSVIFSIATLLFFWFTTPYDSYPAILILFAVIAILFAEFYRFTSGKTFSANLIFILISSLVILEISWAISFLPNSFLGGAAALTIFWFFLQSIYLIYSENMLYPKILARNGLMFALIVLITAILFYFS